MSEPKISRDAVFAAARELCECARDVPPESWSCSDCERDAQRALEAAYPLLRQQWEAELQDRAKSCAGDPWWDGFEAGCSMSHSLGCDAVEAQRDHLVDEGSRLSAVVAEAIAREIEGRIRVWPGMSQQAEARNEHLRQAARIAREAGERAGKPNGSGDSDG